MKEENAMTGRVRLGLLDFEPLRVAGLREIFAERPDLEVIPTNLATALRGAGFDVMFVLAPRQSRGLNVPAPAAAAPLPRAS